MPAILNYPIFKSFREVVDSTKHVPVATDWLLFLCDVENSTAAIKDGNYKDVTTVGASAIMAVCNSIRGEQIPYLFGGDGATFLVPTHLSGHVSDALLGCQKMAETVFKLHLRVGRIPVADLRKAGHEIRIAGHKMSKHFVQAVFSGTGIQVAEQWIRDPKKAKGYLLKNTPVPGVGIFKGLECRWEPLESERGEMLSLIVASLKTGAAANRCYEDVLAKIESIYKPVNPVNVSKLQITPDFEAFAQETEVAGFNLPGWQKWILSLFNYALTHIVAFLWTNLMKEHGETYRNQLVANSDYRKFDGVLKIILDGSRKQHEILEDYLHAQMLDGKLAYGTHVSPSALMTCLIFNRSKGEHLHLVDGADGGYTKAAIQLKENIKSAAHPKRRSA